MGVDLGIVVVVVVGTFVVGSCYIVASCWFVEVFVVVVAAAAAVVAVVECSCVDCTTHPGRNCC